MVSAIYDSAGAAVQWSALRYVCVYIMACVLPMSFVMLWVGCLVGLGPSRRRILLFTFFPSTIESGWLGGAF